jgi:hypothetical protein
MTLLNTHGLGSTVDQGTAGGIKRAKQGSDLQKRHKAAVLRAHLGQLKKLIAEGKHSDEDMRDELNARIHKESQDKRDELTVGQYNELKHELYRQGGADIEAKTTAEVFLEYQWAQQRVLEQLDDLIDKSGEQVNAKLGALRQKSEIIDKVLKTGQDMGLIEKAPAKSIHLHAHAIAKMGDTDLRNLIAQEMSGFHDVMKRFGATDMDGKPVTDDVEPQRALPGPQFTDDMKPKMAMAGPVKSLAARASRRAVKRTPVIDVPG